MVAATATANSKSKTKEVSYSWEGKDKSGKILKGEMRAAGTVVVSSILRRQGINVTKIKRVWATGSITEKDITLFTRQLATMLKSGVPLLQAFDIVGKGHSNRAVAKLLMDIKTDVETGSNLASAFRKYPLYFDALFCNLVSAGQPARSLGHLQGKNSGHQRKDKICPLLPCFDYCGGVRNYCSDHDFCNSCI
jgi:type IV pilus assembly protein PilC